MSIIEQKYMLEKLEKNLLYLNTVEKKNYDEELIVNMILECIDCCNKVNLIQERKQIIKIIDRLGYKDDIRFKIGLDKPYLYIDNDTYSKNEYFTGKYSKNIINYNKSFSYRYQYDKYIRNTKYFENNKYDVDFVIRNYKNILLNTDNERLKELCLNKIYDIYESNPFVDLVDDENIKIINYSDIKCKEDLVSIILMSYNNENYIEDAIKSILDQDYPNLELIVADDHSMTIDNTQIIEYIKKYKKNNLSRVILIRNKVNLGCVSNLNKALCFIKGEIVKIIESDDMFLDNSSITQAVKIMINNKYDILVTCVEVNDKYMTYLDKETVESRNLLKKGYDTRRCKCSLKDKLYMIKNSQLATFPGIFFTKNVVMKYRFDEEFLLLGDYPFFLKLLLNKEEFHYKDQMFVKYRSGVGISTTHNNINNNFLSKEFEKFYYKFYNVLENL